MAKRTSSLDTNYSIGKTTINDNLGVKFTVIKNLQLTQVAVWPETIHKVGSSIANHLNLTEYASPNKVVSN